MDITRSVVAQRDRALLGGDYDAYHAQATRRLHNMRKRLGIANRGRKYSPKAPVTADHVAKNTEWVQLLLTSAERAWAQAMAMKAAQSAEITQKPLPGSTKRQIASRLRRAIMHADNLVAILQDRTTTGAKPQDDLEARAYLSMLKGTLAFERSRWQECIDSYALAQVVYTAFSTVSKSDIYKDLLSEVVDPSIRYAAYQLKMPRTKAVNEIAIDHFPSADAAIRKEVESINADAFRTGTETSPRKEGPREVPSMISWRGRQVKLEDATISQALGVAKEHEDALNAAYASFVSGSISSKDLAPAYEEVITAHQDAADATKTSIDELSAEGVDPGDSRMQALQITRTAVNYAVIEWRIGRNRVLCGSNDGLTFETQAPKQVPKPRKDGKTRAAKEESSGRKISRLREQVALYDSILQSLDAVKELPGVIADETFVSELDAKHSYFRALKCLAIGRSHAINDSISNALALYSRALDLSQEASRALAAKSTATADLAPKLEVSSSALESTANTLSRFVTQHRALAELKNLTRPQSSTNATQSTTALKPPPLIERLDRNTFEDNVDLTNLVNYPPQLRPVPVKPLFFDLAWNYIQYPSQKHAEAVSETPPAQQQQQNSTKSKEQSKKGWFGFGR